MDDIKDVPEIPRELVEYLRKVSPAWIPRSHYDEQMMAWHFGRLSLVEDLELWLKEQEEGEEED
jgi:hypothetical protein